MGPRPQTTICYSGVWVRVGNTHIHTISTEGISYLLYERRLRTYRTKGVRIIYTKGRGEGLRTSRTKRGDRGGSACFAQPRLGARVIAREQLHERERKTTPTDKSYTCSVGWSVLWCVYLGKYTQLTKVSKRNCERANAPQAKQRVYLCTRFVYEYTSSHTEGVCARNAHKTR